MLEEGVLIFLVLYLVLVSLVGIEIVIVGLMYLLS